LPKYLAENVQKHYTTKSVGQQHNYIVGHNFQTQMSKSV